MLNVGIVGCGYWGSKHLRVFSELPECRVVAVCDQDPQLLEQVSLAYPLAFTMTEYDELLACDIHAVVIATPPKTHFLLAKKALLHDKHVLVEKPFTTSSSDAMELIRLAESREDVTLMVGHTFLYNPAVRYLKALLESDELGQVQYIHSARLNFGLLQPDVDVLWDLAAHDISIILYLLGQDPVAVGARGVGCINRQSCEVAHADLVFPDRVHAHVQVSWLDPCKVRKMTLVASRAMVIYDDMASDEMLRIYSREVKLASGNGSPPCYPASYHFGDVRIPHIPWAEPLKEECSHFLQCISKGERPLTDAWNGLQVVRILEGLDESRSLGGVLQSINERPAELEWGATPVAPGQRG